MANIDADLTGANPDCLFRGVEGGGDFSKLPLPDPNILEHLYYFGFLFYSYFDVSFHFPPFLPDVLPLGYQGGSRPLVAHRRKIPLLPTYSVMFQYQSISEPEMLTGARIPAISEGCCLKYVGTNKPNVLIIMV